MKMLFKILLTEKKLTISQLRKQTIRLSIKLVSIKIHNILSDQKLYNDSISNSLLHAGNF